MVVSQKPSACNSVPFTWIDFLPYLAEKFDHKNPELAARTKLQLLMQHNMTVHQYLREFEACYAHILDYDERDTIFRFLFGLKPEWRATQVPVKPCHW